MKQRAAADSVYATYDKESIATIIVLLSLIAVYCYLLFSPTQPHLDALERNFIIKADTASQFRDFQRGDTAASSALGGASEYGAIYSGQSGGGVGGFDDREFDHKYDDFDRKVLQGKAKGGYGGEEGDDFFLRPDMLQLQQQQQLQDVELKPIVPSSSYHCFDGWMLARSELNHKFLWMHQNLNWMSAAATMDTPLHHRAFHMIPVDSQCQDGGWVLLQEGDSQ